MSQHWVPAGARANGVQWINWTGTGEVAYEYTSTQDCQGTTGYFGQP